MKLWTLLAVVVAISALLIERVPAATVDPVFDLQKIRDMPLAAKTLDRDVRPNGIVVERIEFTSDYTLDGGAIRTFGILARPRDKTDVPGIVWAQGGMADAGEYFPLIFAGKGYACLSITLPKTEWNAFAPFDAETPENGNFVRLAVTHMRAITYLTERPEVDSQRLGIGGSSYGGVYATLVAGIDPRVKAGMSFFAGGSHHLGTHLPQFTMLADHAAVDVFRKTADGARGHRQRAVPFLWCAAANDHWFHLPAVVDTFKQAIGDSRLCILPNWAHGFPPHVDQQLIDWFDIHLLRSRTAYNKPGKLNIAETGGRLQARWAWTGTNDVKKAELVVSYGRVMPWCGWVHRLHWPIVAVLDGQTATAEIPVPNPDLEMYIFGNIHDENDVIVSTLPMQVLPRQLGIQAATSRPELNGYPRGNFEPPDIAHLKSLAIAFGTADPREKHAGAQSIRIDPDDSSGKPQPPVHMKLLNVYERDHSLSFWLKADKATSLTAEVTGVPPQNWQLPGAAAARSMIRGTPEWNPEMPLPVYRRELEIGTEWQSYEINCPASATPIEGYNFTVRQVAGGTARYWLDDVRFTPEWH
jgi:hypothetical protein